MVPEVDGYAILLTLSNSCLARKVSSPMNETSRFSEHCSIPTFFLAWYNPSRFLIVSGTDSLRDTRTSVLSSIWRGVRIDVSDCQPRIRLLQTPPRSPTLRPRSFSAASSRASHRCRVTAFNARARRSPGKFVSARVSGC